MSLITTWNCPKCLTTNQDDYRYTVRPMCGSCGLDFEWGEVVDPEQHQALNKQLEQIGLENWKAELRQMITDLEAQWEELDQKIERFATYHQKIGGKGLGVNAGWLRRDQEMIEEKLAQHRLELERVSQ